MEDDGAAIVFDAITLDEDCRQPMRQAPGQDNVWITISFSDGNSH